MCLRCAPHIDCFVVFVPVPHFGDASSTSDDFMMLAFPSHEGSSSLSWSHHRPFIVKSKKSGNGAQPQRIPAGANVK